MKTLAMSIIFGSSFFCSSIFSQNNQPAGALGLPGDNLNLYGVLSLFQSSATLEEFEQKLNAEDSKINNLDLDGDGKIDYIKVFDHVNGTSHAIVLQDEINDKESQDVAVIEVEKDKNNQIQVQIIGDEQLYGKDYIIEPSNGTPNPGYSGNTNSNTNVSPEGKTTVVNNNYYNTTEVSGGGVGLGYAVATWGIIHFIFAPTYVVYTSPWHRNYYPTYWHPWHPIYYDEYYGHWHNHPGYVYYHPAYTYRAPIAHSYYAPRRTTSVVVQQRIIEKRDYNNTYRETRPENRERHINNEHQPIRENRQSPPRQNSEARPAEPANNNNHVAPSQHHAARSEARPANNQNVKPAAKPANNQNARPANNQNNKSAVRPAPKQNSKPEERQNKKGDRKSEER